MKNKTIFSLLADKVLGGWEGKNRTSDNYHRNILEN
jgi:hypothetical protein